MLTLLPGGRILVAVEPVDGRKGIDSLAGGVRSVLQGDPLSGDLFVFKTRRADKLKILAWMGDGFALYLRKQETDCPHTTPFPDSGELGHNLVAWSTSVGAVDSSEPGDHSRRRRMPQPATAVVPPRAHRLRRFTTSRGIG